MDEKFPYEDILNTSYPLPTTEHKISKIDRAAQFASFDALTGLDDTMDETGRVTEEETYLSDENIELLNAKLQILESMLDAEPSVEVVYFSPDSKKSGGTYLSYKGIVSTIDKIEGKIAFRGGPCFKLSDIRRLEGWIFPNF